MRGLIGYMILIIILVMAALYHFGPSIRHQKSVLDSRTYEIQQLIDKVN